MQNSGEAKICNLRRPVIRNENIGLWQVSSNDLRLVVIITYTLDVAMHNGLRVEVRNGACRLDPLRTDIST